MTQSAPPTACRFCGGRMAPACRRCGRTDGDEPGVEHALDVASCALARLLAREELVLRDGTGIIQLGFQLGRALEELSWDAEACHAFLLAHDDMRRLSLSAAELGALIHEIKTTLEAPAGRVRFFPARREFEAPPRWCPALSETDTVRDKWHPEGGCFAATLPGDRPRAAVWSTEGHVVFAPNGAVDIAFSGDGSHVFVLFEHWLEHRTWGAQSLLIERFPLLRGTGRYESITISPGGRKLALVWRQLVGVHRAVTVIDLDAERDRVRVGDQHAHALGPIVFSDDEQMVAHVNFDPDWATAAAHELANEWPVREIDYGTLTARRVDEGAGIVWALWGSPPTEPRSSWDAADGAPAPSFEPERHISMILPNGDIFRRSYQALFTRGPAPGRATEAVRQWLRPRATTSAESLALASEWRPTEPFAADWIDEGVELVVVTRHAISRRSAEDGRVLEQWPAHFPDGPPREVCVQPGGGCAVVLWARADRFSSGYELFQLHGLGSGQLIGRGRRFMMWSKAAQPLLLTHVLFSPDQQRFAVTAGMGGWHLYFPPGVPARPQCVLLFVHDLRTGVAARRHTPQDMLPPGWEASSVEDPDRPLSARFSSDDEIEVRLPFGPLVTASASALLTRTDDAPPYPQTLPSIPAGTARPRLSHVIVEGRGGIGGRFAVPGERETVTATSWDIHVSGALVILCFSEDADGPTRTGVYRTDDGQLVFSSPEIIAMAWATGIPVLRGNADADVLVVTGTELVKRALWGKEKERWRLRLPGQARSVVASPTAAFAVVGWTDPRGPRAGYAVVDLTSTRGVLRGLRARVSAEGLPWAAFTSDKQFTSGAAGAQLQHFDIDALVRVTIAAGDGRRSRQLGRARPWVTSSRRWLSRKPPRWR